MTEATNDNLNGKNHKCFTDSFDKASEKAVGAYLQWKTEECLNDGSYDGISVLGHTWDDAGHYCELKYKEGGRPENPWALVALKLYTQQSGNRESKCYDLLWGNTEESLTNSSWYDILELKKPELEEVFLQ